MSIFFVRHALTEGHLQHRVLGRMAGFGLNAQGREQAEALAGYLAGVHLDLVVSSPVERASETAEIVARRHGLPVILDERFSEVDMGEWTGMYVRDVRLQYADLLAAWLSDAAAAAAPGGESLSDVARRMRAGVDALVSQHPGAEVLVVSHKDPIRAFVCSALDVSLATLRRFDVDMASVTRMDVVGSRYFLKYLNRLPNNVDS